MEPLSKDTPEMRTLVNLSPSLLPSPPLLPLFPQFTLMNYRVSGEFLNSIPFTATTTVEDGDVPKYVMMSLVIT